MAHVEGHGHFEKGVLDSVAPGLWQFVKQIYRKEGRSYNSENVKRLGDIQRKMIQQQGLGKICEPSRRKTIRMSFHKSHRKRAFHKRVNVKEYVKYFS